MEDGVALRDVMEEDLPIFFEQQLDAAACHMAAFTAEDPSDKAAFSAHWLRISIDETITARTILCGERVAGHVLSFTEAGRQEVSYWIGREYWGRGIASTALCAFLRIFERRPLYARAAKDNVGSIRVLEKCGFKVCGEDRGFANARGTEVEEVVLRLGPRG